MADNTTLPGTGDIISTDVITTLNGVGIATGEKAQRVKAGWGVDSTFTDVTATTPLPTSTNASIFRFSAGNTSSAQLTASATFNGARETALDQPSISLLMTSDQPITLTIKQYIDDSETYAVPPIVYNIPANQGFSGSFGLNGNYVRVTAQNTGSATTTTFNLNTAYGSLPSSDGSGRLPVSKADCVQLLSQTMTATGYSNTMDTNGYGAVVAQITGVWHGNGYFEASNNGTDWDTVLVFSRDNLSLQDIVTSGGLYTIRPSGRYLRFTLTSVVGSLVINALGRAAEGISAGDLLSLAMDKQNNAPLYTALSDDTVSKIAQPAMSQVGYGSGFGAIAANTVLCVVDCINYSSLLIQNQVGTSGTVVGQWSNDGNTWSANANWIDTATGVPGNTSIPGVGFKNTPVLGRFFRILIGTATTAGATLVIVFGNRATVTSTGATASSTVGTISSLTQLAKIDTSSATNLATQTRIVGAAGDNKTALKASAGRLYHASLTNLAAYPLYMHFYNTAAASVTVGTTACVYTVACQASATTQLDLGAIGYYFSNAGFTVSVTKGGLDSDATATLANDFYAQFLVG